MTNATILKFGYPQGILSAYEYWTVLIRPRQVTVGCMILACNEEAESLGTISAEAGSELPLVARDLELALGRAFGPDKINYLALMMVDPHVHFHVIPRYSQPVQANGTAHIDTGWPKPPDLQSPLELTSKDQQWIHERLRICWTS